MKNLIIACMLLSLPWIAGAEQDSQPAVHKVEQGGVFKGLMYKVWQKFRAISPGKEQEAPEDRVVATAGIRGAETTGSILNPYWKGDRTRDAQFLRQLNAFADAQAKVEEGDLEQAGEAFQRFMDNWPDSDLRPNAQFALGMTYGGRGQSADSVQAFERFINDNPEHPLVADARALVDEMK